MIKKLIFMSLFSIYLLHSNYVFSQVRSDEDSLLKHTKIDKILEAISMFTPITQKEIDEAKTTGIKISFEKKFNEIDSLLDTGMQPFYQRELFSNFKKTVFEYRNGSREIAIKELKLLISKGFAPAFSTYIAILNEDKKYNKAMKYSKKGIAFCSIMSQTYIMEHLFEKGKEKEAENIMFPKKCYKE